MQRHANETQRRKPYVLTHERARAQGEPPVHGVVGFGVFRMSCQLLFLVLQCLQTFNQRLSLNIMKILLSIGSSQFSMPEIPKQCDFGGKHPVSPHRGSAEHWMAGQLMGPEGRTWQWLRVGLWDPGTAPSCCITVIGGGERGEFSTMLGASVSSPVHGRY